MLDVSKESLNSSRYLEGFAYDSKDEFEEVVKEAKAEHPDADFSRVAA